MAEQQNVSGETYDERMAALNKWEEECIQKYGFYVHHVPNGDDTPTGVNVHTHGVLENFGHLDLQIVLPLDSKVALSIFHDVVNLIKSGSKFEADESYSGIIRDFKVTFAETVENGRRVLRLCFPDKHGGFSGVYASQFKNTEQESFYCG